MSDPAKICCSLIIPFFFCVLRKLGMYLTPWEISGYSQSCSEKRWLSAKRSPKICAWYERPRILAAFAESSPGAAWVSVQAGPQNAAVHERGVQEFVSSVKM